MEALEVLIISIGLTLDVFAYAIIKGAMISKIDRVKVAKICLIFTVWQVGAMLLGNLVGHIPIFHRGQEQAAYVWKVVTAIILFAIGVYMLIKAQRHHNIIEHKEDTYPYRQFILWAWITSIDAFLVGIGYAFFDTHVLMTVVMTGITTILGVIFGIYAGYRLGCSKKNQALAVGGCLLLIAGLEITFKYLV